MLRYLSAFAMFLAIFFSATASASDYYWSNNHTAPGYKSADEACIAINGSSASYYGSEAKYKSAKFVNESYANCLYAGTTSSNEKFEFVQGAVYRDGDSCVSGSTYNSLTGACDKPAQADGENCKDQTGARGIIPMIYSAKTNSCVLMTEADDDAACHWMGANSVAPSMSFTVSGTLNSSGELQAVPKFAADGSPCEMQTVSQSDCTLHANGPATCEVHGSYTGEVNKVSDNKAPVKSLCVSELGCLDTSPVTTVSDSPCTGDCTSETSTETTGVQNCGTFNGVATCVTKVKPISTDTKATTATATITNADKSVTSTTTKKTDKNTCTNVKTCTSTTSTTIVKSTTTVAGKTTTSSSCTGTCSGTGSGSTGTGTGSGDEDKDGGSATASDDCTVPPACSGDVFSCAILRQEYLDSCAARALPTVKQKADFQAEIDKQTAGLDANQKTMDDSVTSLVSRFQSAASGSGSGGKCFDDKTFSIQGFSIVLPFSQACPYLEWFRYAVLAIAYLIALRIVSKEF